MSDSTTPTALSPYAHLAEGYLIFLRALRRHVKQQLADGESGDGWWTGPVRERLDRQVVGSFNKGERLTRWGQINSHRKKRLDERRPPEDFLDPHDLVMLVEEFQIRLVPESDFYVHRAQKFRPQLITMVVQWRNQFFAHPGSEPPSAAEVVGFLHPARTLLESFNLPEEAQIKAIIDAMKTMAGASDSLEHERAVGAVIAGLRLYGDGGSVRLSIARSYADLFLAHSGDAPIPQDDADLLSLIEKDEHVKAEQSAEGTVWVRLSDSATSTEPQPLPRRASTSTPPIHDDASPMAEEWIPRGIEAILEVRLRNGWAPIRWCEHVLTSRYGMFPGAEADTGAVGAFFKRYSDDFKVVGSVTSGRVRLQQRSRASVSGDHVGEDEAVKATDIRDAIVKHAGSDGWAAVMDVVADLTIPGDVRLVEWLRDRPDRYEVEQPKGGLGRVRFVGQVEERDSAAVASLSNAEAIAPAQHHAPETEEADKDGIPGPPTQGATVDEPTPAQSPEDRNQGSAQAPYPEWADIVVRTIEERSDQNDGWAKVPVVHFHIGLRRPEFDPSAYGFTTLLDLLASREDLFEVRDRRTGDSVGPDLVRIRGRSEPIEADALSMGSRQEPATEGSVGQEAAPTQERDPDWPDWAHLIAQAMESSGLRDGWANLGTVGNQVKRLQPEFEPRELGFSRLRDLVESRLDLFEIQDRRPQGIAAADLWIRIRGGRAGAE